MPWWMSRVGNIVVSKNDRFPKYQKGGQYAQAILGLQDPKGYQ